MASVPFGQPSEMITWPAMRIETGVSHQRLYSLRRSLLRAVGERDSRADDRCRLCSDRHRRDHGVDGRPACDPTSVEIRDVHSGQSWTFHNSDFGKPLEVAVDNSRRGSGLQPRAAGQRPDRHKRLVDGVRPGLAASDRRKLGAEPDGIAIPGLLAESAWNTDSSLRWQPRHGAVDTQARSLPARVASPVDPLHPTQSGSSV